VEELVAGTNSGSSPVLASYYQFWEKKIYNAIAKMTITSLASFIVLLQVSTALTTPYHSLRLPDQHSPTLTTHTHVQGKYVGPLCKVSVTINGKDIVLSPPVNDIYKYLTKLGRNIVESSRLFVRWMHGSCLECPPQFISEDEEPFVFSFLEVGGRDIALNGLSSCAWQQANA
jgi:dynein heavy chain